MLAGLPASPVRLCSDGTGGGHGDGGRGDESLWNVGERRPKPIDGASKGLRLGFLMEKQ